jgi:DeoR family transcriptional regulator, fructose operon transcriptional repressor
MSYDSSYSSGKVIIEHYPLFGISDNPNFCYFSRQIVINSHNYSIMVLHEQKIEAVLGLLEGQAYWTSQALAKRLGISRSTIQRCLEELDRRGLAVRIHGGVRRVDTAATSPIPLSARAGADRSAKEAMAQAALERLGRSGSVYLDAGTTVLPLARRLETGRHQDMFFVTNDVAIALVLARKRLRHLLLSGSIHPVTQVISGPSALKQVGDFHFDVCFISVDGIDHRGRTTCALMDEALLKRQAMEQSREKLLLAASSKWDHGSGAAIGELKAFTAWITEKASLGMKKTCQEHRTELIIAMKNIKLKETKSRKRKANECGED